MAARCLLTRPERLAPRDQRGRASIAAARSRERRWQGLMPAESDIARFFDGFNLVEPGLSSPRRSA